MTNNHLLLYRLAELMVEKQQHIIALDDLFEDEQIGAFVRSIQIDSPYQQLIFEGVLTETIKEERIMVTFTVEGYFHYVLGEVIEQQAEGKRAEALKELLENNKLRGITEGVEQCLVRDVEKDDLSRLMWLIDEGGKALEASAYPLAQAFLIHPIEKVMDELLADTTDNDINVLEKAIEKLEEGQKEEIIKNIYTLINKRLEATSVKTAVLLTKSTNYIEKKLRIKTLEKLEVFSSDIKSQNLKKLFYQLARSFEFNQQFEKALFYFDKSLKIKSKDDKKNKINRVEILNSKGYLQGDMGNYDNALKLHYKALEIAKNIYDSNSTEIAETYAYISLAYKDLEKYDLALEYQKKSLSIVLKNFGKFDNSTAKAYFNIGAVYYHLENYVKALEFYNKTDIINKKIYNNNNHYCHAQFYQNAAMVYGETEEIEKAMSYYNKALKIDIYNFGKIHKSVSIIYNNIASIFKKQDQYDLAILNYNKALNIDKELHGTNHPNLGNKYYNLGLVYTSKKDYENAIKNFKESLKIKKENLNQKHPSIARTYHQIGNIYKLKNNIESALENYNNALKIKKLAYPKGHAETVWTTNRLAEIYLAKNDQKKANDLYFLGLKIILKIYDKLSNNAADQYYEICKFFRKTKNYSKAIEYSKKTLEIDLKNHGEIHNNTSSSYRAIASIYEKMKDYNNELLFLKKANKSNNKSSYVYYDLGYCYENLNNYKESILSFIKCAEILRKKYGIDDEDTKEVIEEAMRLAKETNNLELLPDWIKKIANDQ